jgi:hypothetical protein
MTLLSITHFAVAFIFALGIGWFVIWIKNWELFAFQVAISLWGALLFAVMVFVETLLFVFNQPLIPVSYEVWIGFTMVAGLGLPFAITAWRDTLDF